MEWSWRARVAFVLVLLSISVAQGSGAVTEPEAIRIFLEQSPQARRVAVIEQTVDAELRVETRVANPSIAYQVEDAAGVRDEFLTFQQELPITGRRGLLNDRAELAASAAAIGAENDLRSDVYALKQAFHDVLYRQRALETLRDGGDLLARTVEILQTRETEGEGSGYDVLRAEQELADLRIAIVEAEAALSAARSRFGSFFDAALNMEAASLQGDLQPAGSVLDAQQATDIAVAQRLDLQSLSAEREGLDLEYRAARRRRFPEPLLTAGWKRTEALGLSDTGYIAAVSVPLPFFGRGRFESARAAAAGERVELETEILTRRIRSEVQTAVAREHAAREAADRYGQDIAPRAGELNRIARLQYDEGESGILELLDAHRTSLTMRLRALATRYTAKVAEIDRNRAIGNEVKP
ncbi:MAG: TolC family protein [Gemmatimonadetes bacterium]|nr:TolC family protein [Gemmatimonadota bacterium]